MNKASNYRQRRNQQPALTTELTLPSGEVFTVRRPPLELWVTAGRIPQSFVKHLIDAQASDGAPSLTADDTMAAVVFTRDAILYSVVDPPLRLGAQPDDADGALDPSELDPADFEFLAAWIMRGSPGVPVATEGGAVTTDALAAFRQKRPGGGVAGAGADGPEVREPSEPLAAAD